MIIIREKKFGIISKVKRNLAAKLLKSMRRDLNSRRELSRELSKQTKESPKDPKVMKYLGNKAKEYNIKILKGRKKDNRFDGFLNADRKIDTKPIKEYSQELLSSSKKSDRKIGKHILDNDYLISQKTGQHSLAHEIGHVMNDKQIVPGIISRLKDKHRIGKKLNNGEKGLVGSIKNYIKGTLEVAEESNATKNALNLLKKGGASKKDLKIAKDDLDKALNIYKIKRSIMTKLPIFKSLAVEKK